MLNQYNPARIQIAIQRLADHLISGKVIPMEQQNLGEPRRAFAGIEFVLVAAQKVGQLNVQATEVQTSLDLARRWQQNVMDRLKSDIEQGHQYNLCPAYFTLLRQLALLSSDYLVVDAEAIQKLMDEW